MKLPFEFGGKLVFRLALPGLVFALSTQHVFRVAMRGLAIEVDSEILLGVIAALAGWVFVISDMHIYMLFEGRRYWPHWLAARFVSDEWSRLVGLRRRIKRQRVMSWAGSRISQLRNALNVNSQMLRSAVWPLRIRVLCGVARERRKMLREVRRLEGRNSRQAAETAVDYRRFPINSSKGRPMALQSTRLGNLLTSYEQYPSLIYGLDAPFYWPRLWMNLDKDLREELDAMQALADSTVYTSFALYASALINFIYCLSVLLVSGIAEVDWTIALMGAGCLSAAYGLYRGSIHLHDQYGELFKAVFDVHGGKIDLAMAENELGKPLWGQTGKSRRVILWRYLRNYRIKDEKTGRVLTPGMWTKRNS
jgi:hypothetical protein